MTPHVELISPAMLLKIRAFECPPIVSDGHRIMRKALVCVRTSAFGKFLVGQACDQCKSITVYPLSKPVQYSLLRWASSRNQKVQGQLIPCTATGEYMSHCVRKTMEISAVIS